MTLAAQNAQIVSIVNGVSGTGIVHGYQRLSLSYAEWIALMTNAGIINGWTVSRKSTSSNRDSYTTNRCGNTFCIKGYYEIDDANASETTFQALVEGIRQAFNAQYTLCGQAIVCGPAEVDIVDVIEIPGSNNYVHYCELSIVADMREFF